MGDVKKVTDRRDRDGDGIIDAEFVEIDNARSGDFDYRGPFGRTRPKSDSWWARQHLVIQCLLVLGGFMFAAILVEAIAEAVDGGRQNSSAPAASAQSGMYPLPSECENEPVSQQGACVRGLVEAKTSQLSDRVDSRLSTASKQGAIKLLSDAKVWNDNVDTVCTEQSKQYDPSDENSEKTQYYACIYSFLDKKLKEDW